MEAELTIPVPKNTNTELCVTSREIILIFKDKIAYEEFKRTLEDVLESMDNMLKNYW